MLAAAVHSVLLLVFVVLATAVSVVLPWGVSFLVLAAALQSVVLVFVLAVAVHSVFLLWGWCILSWLLLWGGNFLVVAVQSVVLF